MEKSVLVPVADGSEELETVAIVDVLRRSGAHVTLAAVKEPIVTGSKGVKLITDGRLSEHVHEVFDLIALPGGMPGAEHLRDSPQLIAMLTDQADAGRIYAAICASPAVVFHSFGLLRGKRFTCHPNFAERLPKDQLSSDRVVVDGNLVTSRGAGTAVEFALTLVGLLYGDEKAQEVRRGMAI